MTPEEKQAYEWAINQNFPSVSARYARILAGKITALEADNRRYEQLLLACENLILDANARPGAYLYADLGPIRTIIAAIIIEEENR